jgi:YVTN family beta-propeller protein
MSQIIFGGTVSMLNVATPSTGWIVGYDDDGILKQKDIFGIITEIGGGLATGGSQSIEQVLLTGNNTEASSIIMGTSTYIGSANGGGIIKLDSGGITNSISITTDYSFENESGLIMDKDLVSLFIDGYNKTIELDNINNHISVYNLSSGSILLGVQDSPTLYEQLDEIKISYNTLATASTGDYDKQSVFIGTRNSQIGTGVVNTVVIGGDSIIATNSNSIYVPNIVVQNNKTIKSEANNSSINLNDINGDIVIDRNLGNFDKSWFRMSESESGYDYWSEIIVNSSTGLTSGIIIQNKDVTSLSNLTSIKLEKESLSLLTDGPTYSINLIIDPNNNIAQIQGDSGFKGIEYNSDFSASYSTRSLVDKNYVDSQVSSIGTPNISTVLGVGNNTQTRSIIMGTSTHIKSGNSTSGGQINLDFAGTNAVLLSTDNAALTSAYVLLQNGDVSIQSSNFNLQATNGQVEIGNNEGLKYTTQQTNLQNRSLIDKEYVDLGTSSIWNSLTTIAYSPTSSVANYIPFYTSARNLSATSSIYSSTQKTKGTLNQTYNIGTSPKHVFYDPNSKKIIVTNEGSNNVSIIDTVSKSVIGTVSVGVQPHGIAFDENTNNVFISNKGSGNVSKFNLNTLVVSATISVGTFPCGLQYLENKVYVANQLSNNISVINASTNLVTATISTSTPRDFTWDYSNRNLWFIGVGPDYIGVLDPDTNTVINSIQVGSNPFNIEFDHNNERAYVTNNGSNNVSVVDINTSLIVATISVGTSPDNLAYNPVNNFMYVANYTSGSISEIDTNTLSITSTYTYGTNIGGLAYDEYFQELYFTRNSLNTISSLQTVNIPTRLIGINKLIPTTELDVEGTITSTGFRLRNGGSKDYVLTSDDSGRGSWQPISTTSEVIAGLGLTGGGYSSSVTLSASVDNGLSLSSGDIVLGGTLSQTTTINLSTFDLTISSSASDIELNRTSTTYPGVTNTLKLEDKYVISESNSTYYRSSIELENEDTGVLSIELMTSLGTYSNAQRIRDNYISSFVQSIDGSGSASYFSMWNSPQTLTSGDSSINNHLVISDQLGNKGLVYDEDYSPNFTDNSLVTKNWVNTNTTSKYSLVRGFTASITETINHNLGTDEVIVQCYDSSGIQVIPGTIQINGLNAVDITFSSTMSNIKTVIIG